MDRRILSSGNARSAAQVDKQLQLDDILLLLLQRYEPLHNCSHLFSSKRLRAINMCPVLFIYLHSMFVNFI
jgi:hypothetical protein